PITIPSGTPSGIVLFEVEALFGVCGTGCSAFSDFSVSVNSSPSALSYQLGAGSGLTVGWLILFLLIVIVVIVILVMMRRRGRPM
ncbi:hypothetical protein, partial [Salmonella sp. SAL04284]|uniref:hypothetical protein n=1 Tax=Salmonella sp. SAL04284 TaxID=3159862 RepID=UPI00397CF5FC